MKSHLLLLLIASGIISVVLSMITRENWAERKKMFLVLFFSLAGFCVVSAWIMYLIHS